MKGLNCVLLVCSVGFSTAIKLVREELSAYPLAKCNDGSSAVYFHQQGSDYKDKDVMIFLPDGGHCTSIQNCRERCDLTPSACGSTSLEKELSRDHGIWSSNAKMNPFANHHKIEIHYCTSDNYAGTRSSSAGTGNMFFHGKHVMTAALEDLSARFGLAAARSVTLVGTGSGARGVGYNCDYVDSVLPTVNVRCLADSPDLVPWWLTSDLCQQGYPGDEEMVKVFWGREEDESCIRENKLMVNSSELAQRCGIWSRYWDHVRTPLFIVASQFDTNSLPDPACLPDPESEEYTEFELAWRRGVAALFESMLATDSGKSWFVPDCRTHGYLSMNGDTESQFSRLTVSNLEDNKTMSLTESLAEWINTTTPIHSIDQVAAGNLECRESAPLCHSSFSCSSGRRSFSSYPSVRSRWLAPSSIYPRGYSRGWSVDPWYTSRSSHGGNKVLVSGAGYGGTGILGGTSVVPGGVGYHGTNILGTSGVLGGGDRHRGTNIYGTSGILGGGGGYRGTNILGTSGVHSQSSDRRRRLWKRLRTLQYLKELYNRHKTEYARDYYGYDDVHDHPVVVTTGTRAVDHPAVVTTVARVPLATDVGIGLGTRVATAGIPDVVGTRTVLGLAPGDLGGVGLGCGGCGGGRVGTRVLGGLPDLGVGLRGTRVAAAAPGREVVEVVQDYDYDYVYYEDYGNGLVSRIRNAIRLKKQKDSKDKDDVKERSNNNSDNDFDDFEDFGPLIEKIIEDESRRRRQLRQNQRDENILSG